MDPYAVLGVPENAGDEEIKTAYKNAAKFFHPDTNQDPGAVEIFREIQAAYEILSDPQKKADYLKNLKHKLTENPRKVIRERFKTTIEYHLKRRLEWPT